MSRKDKLIAKLLALPKDMSFSDVQKILEWHGYELNRVKGSHHMFTKTDFDPVVIPVHNKSVKIDYLKKIIKAIPLEDAND